MLPEAWISMEIVLMGKVKKDGIILAQLLLTLSSPSPFYHITIRLLYHPQNNNTKAYFIFCYKLSTLKFLSNLKPTMHVKQNPQEIQYLFFELKYQLTFGEVPAPWQPH